MNTQGRHDADVLKKELVGLFNHIQRIRREIAAIRRPGAASGEDHFMQMSDELDAIVEATEQATNSIMENVEQMEDLLNDLRALQTDPAAVALLDQIPEKTAAIFEACAFQDITGQRITKVVNSLQFVETRVNALVSMWGANELTKVGPQKTEERDEYKRYLNGPQLSGQGVSQADIDAMLFGATPAAVAKPVVAPTPAPPPKPAPVSAQPPAAKPAAPAPVAAKPAAAPAPAPKPAPTPKPVAAKPSAPPASEGPAMGQDDIDKLFG